MVVRGRCVGVSLVVLALLAAGIVAAMPASAQLSIPTPTHLVVGLRITLSSELRVANSVGSQTLVTPMQARAIAVSMWLQWEGAMISRNTTALTQLTPPGALLSGELYQCAWPSGGCVSETHVRPVYNVTPVVPIQRSYPIYFLAEVSTIQNTADGNAPPEWVPWIELQVLTKASASAPWQLSFDTGYNGTDNQQPPLLPFELEPARASRSSDTQDLYNSPRTSPATTPRSTFLALLAQYYQSFKDTGRPPSNDRFKVGGTANGYGSQQATARQGNIAEGSRNHYDFSADPRAGEWEFAGAAGHPIECGTVLDTSTNTPIGAYGLLQNADRTNFGMPLAPGTYSSITTTTTHPTCIDDVDGVLDAAGDSGYTSGVSGSRRSISS